MWGWLAQRPEEALLRSIRFHGCRVGVQCAWHAGQRLDSVQSSGQGYGAQLEGSVFKGEGLAS